MKNPVWAGLNALLGRLLPFSADSGVTPAQVGEPRKSIS